MIDKLGVQKYMTKLFFYLAFLHDTEKLTQLDGITLGECQESLGPVVMFDFKIYQLMKSLLMAKAFSS